MFIPCKPGVNQLNISRIFVRQIPLQVNVFLVHLHPSGLNP